MIVDWLGQIGPLLLAILVVFGPGLLIGAASRLRGLLLLAVAPAVSFGALALLALVFPFLSVRWGHASAAIGTAVLAAAALGVSALLRPRVPPRGQESASGGRTWVLVLAGLVVGGALNAARLMAYVGRPDALSQTNDAVFHLNALRWISETGSASSLDVSGLIGAQSFYPSAWHAVTSLVATDVDLIPVAVNMVALVIAALVWPVGIAVMTRVVLNAGATATAVAAALSATMMAFPQLVFEWGVLYPYAVSVAVLPGVFALFVVMMRSWEAAASGQGPRVVAGSAIVFVIGVVAILLSQPSTVLVLGLLVMAWATWAVLAQDARSRRARAVWIAVVCAGWLALAGAWLVLSYLAGPVLWRSYRSIPGAAVDVLLQSHSQLPAAPAVSALLLIGIVVAVRRDRRLGWLVLVWGAVSVLYVISVATDLPVIKRALTGAWYGDSFRLAALVPLVVVPLATLGAVALIRGLASRPWTLTAGRETRLLVVTLCAIAVSGAVTIAMSPVTPLRVGAEIDEQSRYTINDRSYLSEDEYTLLRRVPEVVSEDGLILVNPSTGAAFGYVLSERETLPRTWSPPQSDAWDVLASSLRDAGDDPAVCEALAAYGAPEYVLDFGIGGTGPGEYLMPGMTDFDGRDGFIEVAREGDASLWRITACG